MDKTQNIMTGAAIWTCLDQNQFDLGLKNNFCPESVKYLMQ